MKSVVVSLLDKNGEVQYGLNWGQRENRDPNQAYLQLTPDIYKSDYFPVKGKYFIVTTDDKEILILNRAQKDYGCALQTPENNSIIGVYLRRRLGVDSGAEITKEHILQYGKSEITFTKIDDMHYSMDFSNGKSIKSSNFPNDPLQLIFYGAPGTGKSFKIDGMTNDDNTIRTTFHPDSDYASFVGAYKPTMEDVAVNALVGKEVQRAIGVNGHPGTEKKIVYKYVPQAFLKAYVAAWKDLDNPHFLVIEEINRGNCAQIFGDLFQLLDRNSQGRSSYAIHADEDISQFLATDDNGFANIPEETADAIRNFVLRKDNGQNLEIGADILSGKKLLLPPNLYIWATMNTSDQSLFPIDSAFKRRWNWEYIAISYKPIDKKTGQPLNWLFEVGDKKYSWGEFLEFINPKILKLTESADKQMGYFFAKPDKKSDPSLEHNDVISEKVFLNKVLFYIWTDALKDFDITLDEFKKPDGQRIEFADFFIEGENILAHFVGNTKLKAVGDDTAEPSAATPTSETEAE